MSAADNLLYAEIEQLKRERRLKQPRRVSHPKLGYLGTIRRIGKEWVYHSAVRPGRIHEVIGSTVTGREAVKKLEELALKADERALAQVRK